MEDNILNISDIINALNVIKLECSKYSKCDDCPFFKGDMCGIKHIDPEKWEITSQYIWRAFK